MLNAVTSVFSGGRNKVVISAGGKSASPPPVEALLARRRSSDTTTGVLSRMEEAKNKNMVWRQELHPLIEQRLRSMFHPDNFARMRLTQSEWTNIMRRIVEDISILYESPASRYLEEEKQKQTDGAGLDEGKTDAGDMEEGPTEEESAAEDAPETKTDEQPQDDTEADTGTQDGAEGKPPPKKAPPPKPVAPPADGAPPDGNIIGTGEPDIDALAEVLDLEGVVEDAQSPFDMVMELVDLDVILDSVEKHARIHEAVWVRPFVTYEKTLMEPDEQGIEQEKGDPSTAKLTFIVYDPSQADVVEDPQNPAEALAWYYWGKEIGPDGTLVTVIHFFTKDNYWKFTQDWKVIDSGPNLLERLPVTVFRKEMPSPQSYYCCGVGRDLYEATLEFNILRTIQNARFRDSGFKQLVMTNVDPKDVPADQVMGGPTPVYVPEGGNASVLDMSPALDQMTAMVEQRALELAATYGITAADYKAEGGGPQSGFAKKLDRDKVLKENKRIRKFFQQGEKDLYALLAKVLEVYPMDGIPALDAKQKYQVDFAEPSFEDDPGTQAVTDAQDLKLHKTSIVDILKRLNPDLNEVELVKLAYRNKRINEAFIDPGAMKLVDILAHKVGVASAGEGGAPGDGGGFGKPKDKGASDGGEDGAGPSEGGFPR